MRSIMNVCLTHGLLLLAGGLISAVSGQTHYLVGIGKGDVTGPAADVNLMGYAVLNQTAKGIHIRQWARAFVFADPARPSARIMLVNIDAAMAAQWVTQTVIQQLKAEYDGLYNEDNVIITATHTHASAGGFLTHFLYHITSLGFVKQTFDALVDGILESCRAAHADLRLASVSWSSGELLDANINRSPTAYMANPEAERAQYTHDVDKEMTLLRVTAAEDGKRAKGRGMLSWFAVHCTSMNNTNTLLSGDNKGAAEQFVEKVWAPQQQQHVDSDFVAAFVQTNVADTSPNTLGTFCLDTGLPCDASTSTCNGNNHFCIGRGPAFPDDTKSTEIIGQRQADMAQELWFSPGHAVSGPIDHRHVYIDMTHMEVAAGNYTRTGHTCPGAMGYSFAAGTTDGPGATGFYQSDNQNHQDLTPTSALVTIVNVALHSSPSSEQSDCQGAKPILLNVGEAEKPYPWVPRVTELSLLRLGNFVILCVPGEFTTMAGRRIRKAVYETVKSAWGSDVKVVLAGLCNTYSSYITTYEEYQVQRYEGGSTLYGPHTLDAYIQSAVGLAEAMVQGKPVVSTTAPNKFDTKLLSFLTPVVLDTVPKGKAFGEVIQQPKEVHKPGETVEVVFWSANPRNNLRRNSTFLQVQQHNAADDEWKAVHSDDDWCTKFIWNRPKGMLSSESTATIKWDVPHSAAPGKYRVVHYGDWKAPTGKITPFHGVSNEFSIK